MLVTRSVPSAQSAGSEAEAGVAGGRCVGAPPPRPGRSAQAGLQVCASGHYDAWTWGRGLKVSPVGITSHLHSQLQEVREESRQPFIRFPEPVTPWELRCVSASERRASLCLRLPWTGSIAQRSPPSSGGVTKKEQIEVGEPCLPHRYNSGAATRI